MTARIRVAVVYGGRSSEHAISCVSAGSILRNLDPERFEVVAVGISPEGSWMLTDARPETLAITDGHLPQVSGTSGAALALPADPRRGGQLISLDKGPGELLAAVDVVFPVLHGPYGEDGTVQGLLELAGVPYVGAGVLASAAGMDKEFTKKLLAAEGLPIGDQVVLRAQNDTLELEDRERLGLPVFVKPARGGSSIGVSRVVAWDQLPSAIALARRHDPKVIVEAAIPGRELECGVLEFEDGPRASVPAEIPPVTAHAFYDFEAKYIDSAEGIVPAPLTEAETAEVQRLAVAAFDAASCEGLVRADFFLLDNGEFVINEINTMPGFTPISMYPRMWQESGVSYPELVDRLIQAALRRSTGLR